MTIVRKPAVAGSFYPSDKNQLNHQLERFLQQTKTISLSGQLKILVVPHAGIVYSGQTAAWGFKQIENKDYQKIILLGASHIAWFDQAAVFNHGVWMTPLGEVAIDEQLASQIVDDKEKIAADLRPHQMEHDLEVEVIFLQKVLVGFKIVPILVSSPSDRLINHLAKKIGENLDEKTLLIISSDLSHYPGYRLANQVDNKTITSILTGKKQLFENTVKSLEEKNYPGLETVACGYQAIRIGLQVGEKLGLKWKKIFYENSGDLPAEALAKVGKSRVVGYASIIGYI